MVLENTGLAGILERRQGDCQVPCELRAGASAWLERILGLLVPELSDGEYKNSRLDWTLSQVLDGLYGLVRTSGLEVEAAREVVSHFRGELPRILSELDGDAELMHSLDPASESVALVKMSYPGFLALAVHRLAHILVGRVPMLPRVLTEDAHRQTGIDIHPGAKIASPFAIDHGTGIVIGETAEVGRGVQIFQGVTLGAMSVKKSLAGVKRHPSIEDDVVIYAGATILGGETVVGRGSVVGGNVWLTESVAAGSVVTNQAQVDVRVRKQK